MTRTAEDAVRCREMENERASGRAVPRVALPAEPVQLRSAPVDLADGGCADAARRWNFYSYDNDATGCFVNAYVKGRDVVSDLATGLMWEQGASPLVSFEEAEHYLQGLNGKKLGGFSDWRLPTTEEFLSILEAFGSESDEYDRHLDKGIFVTGSGWWTSDYYAGGKKRWEIETLSEPGCRTQDPEDKSPVRAVRTMSKQELEKARKKYEKGK